MGKKLVKTAKQQFEERLRELNVVKEWKMCDTEIYYLCEDGKAHVHLLRDQDGEYKELSYGMQYEALVFSERFLSMMSERFTENNVMVKPLFDWYASADHDEEPFNLLDIYMCELEESHFTFEDLYEEVPDVRIITAKEQWENDSKDAKLCCNLDNGTIWKVLVEKDRLAFFRSNNEDGFYHRYDLPSMDNLRKDAAFIVDYLSLVQDMHPEDLESAVTWIKKGVYTMSDCSMMDIYQSSKTQGSYEYEDKEIDPTKKKDFSEEIEGLRLRLIVHIEELCEQGMTVNVDSFLQNVYSITWVGGSYYACANIKDVYFRKNTENEWEFSYESKSDAQGDSSDCSLNELSIESLQDIIAAMQ